MNTYKPFHKITILSLLLVMVITACAPKTTATTTTSQTQPTTSQTQPTTATTQPTAQYLDTFIFATSQEPTLVDPAIIYDGSDRITRLIYETLFNYKGSSTKELEPALATEYSVSADGLTYTFKLREGVTFQDDTPFNADAVKFSFDRMVTIGKGFAWAYWMLKEVKVVDEFTVDFVLTQQFPFFPYLIANRYGSPIVSPGVMVHEVDGDFLS
jgi:peptide/nickel transport system substrate-binding protein